MYYPESREDGQYGSINNGENVVYNPKELTINSEVEKIANSFISFIEKGVEYEK